MYLLLWYSPLADEASREVLQDFANRTDKDLKAGWLLPKGTRDYIRGNYSYDPHNFIVRRFAEWLFFDESDGVQFILCDHKDLTHLILLAREQFSFVSDYEISPLQLREWMTEVFLLTEAQKAKRQLTFAIGQLKRGFGVEEWAAVDSKLFDISLNFEEEVAKFYHRVPTELIRKAWEQIKQDENGHMN
ncbi:protein of unknown function [Magnetospirillum gryphiswaldense MSR-1 v2]|uniref:Uncharacterized protein n=1 Tax=Magnetospirillum gryphiswaldense (strain DSM 6361 / JCM 21280 / NBRC 15271 / MSR-1) TaxID=431944 RepID=V6F4A4_MAGGM|nr:hypothetical protein [Magnetospirillum gryphiswaldense]CDL00269.1 protein of unknown function [Magnetospirillum gryphiswaldense MSR-1 v2]